MTIKRQYGPLDFDQVASRSLYCFSSDIDEEEIPEMYEEDRQRGDTSYLDEYIPALKEYLLNREYTFEEKWFFIGGGMQKNEIHCAEGYLRHIWGIMTSPPFAHEEWPVPQEQYRDLISQIGLMRYYYLQSTFSKAWRENRLPDTWTDRQCIWESLPPLDVSRLEDKEYLEAQLERARRATENVEPLTGNWWTKGCSGAPTA